MIPKEEYDKLYYGLEPLGEGEETHTGGYGEYGRTVVYNADSGLELYKNRHTNLYNEYTGYLAGGKFLSLGCATGMDIEDLRALGVDAYGVEWSDYIQDFIPDSVKPYVFHDDVISHLQSIPDNHYFSICGIRFLPCMSDTELDVLIPLCIAKSTNQLFIVDDFDSYPDQATRDKLSDCYNIKTMEEWQTLLDDIPVQSTVEARWRPL